MAYNSCKTFVVIATNYSGGRVELPPSPVPNRNALSKAKHRARSSSAHSRVRSGLGSSQMSGEATASHNILDVTAASNSNVQQLEQKVRIDVSLPYI